MTTQKIYGAVSSSNRDFVQSAIAAGLGLAVQLGACTAWAQEQSAAVLEEVVVTANKRSQSLQDVAASVSALTTGSIERQGLDDFAGVARVLPGVTLNQPVKNRAVFNIRGLSTNIGGGNTQDPVAVYINDMPVTDTFGASVQPDLRLYDVERVEVLRGPQGTLFGSGSLAGTVRIITNKPEMSAFDGSLRADLANTDDAGLRQRYDAMVNIPLVDDSLALRAVAYYRDEAGWVDNLVLGTDNSTEDKGGRLSLRWQPGDAFRLTGEVLYQDSDPEDGDSWAPELGKFNKSSTLDEGRPSTITSYNLTLEYVIPDFADLVSTTSYLESETAVSIDYGDITGLGFPLHARNAPWEIDFLTQELRLVSNTDSGLDWVLGAFYIERESVADFNFQLVGLADFFNPILGAGLPPSDNFLVTRTTTRSEEMAVFADINYQLTGQWYLGGGVRVADTEVSINEPRREVLNFATFLPAVMSFSNEGEDSGIVTWRGSLSYQPADSLHFYASVSKGYRIGQTNPFVGRSPVDPEDPLDIPNIYQPDETLNYELGAKTLLWGQRLRLNVAAYYIEWEDIQVDAIRLSDVANYIANAGEAISRGVEVEMQLTPLEGLVFDLSLALQDAEIDSISAADSLRSGVLEGDILPGSMDYTLAAAVQYTWPLASGRQMYARLAAQLVDSSPNGFSNQAGSLDVNPFLAENEAYENVDASIGLVTDQWELSLYGENLTNNDDYILNGGANSGVNYINTLRPRTLGMRLHYFF
ncbi:MAG: TonB-dependent receptor [Haliea sp.]|uniref:TonB-dependent receptor n=1 Tax=Haliea sp. TaxID=1932666 RepID=UPI0032ED0AE6